MRKPTRSTKTSKSKTDIEWKGKHFKSRKDLIAHVREQIKALVAAPITEKRGDKQAFLHFVSKVTLTLSDARRRHRRVKSTPAARPSDGVQEEIPPLELPEDNPYFPDPSK